MRSSICAVSSSVTGFSNATSRAANHICLWPPSSSNPLRHARALRTGPGRGAASRCRRRSRRSALQVAEVGVADHRAEALDGADARQRRDRSARARLPRTGTSPARRSGTSRATSSSGTSRTRCRTARGGCCCHASIAGTRFLVRGETYAPSSSKPPWQRTPPATAARRSASVASSSSSVHSAGGSCVAPVGQRGVDWYTAKCILVSIHMASADPAVVDPALPVPCPAPPVRRRSCRAPPTRSPGPATPRPRWRTSPPRRASRSSSSTGTSTPRRRCTGRCSQQVFDRLAEVFVDRILAGRPGASAPGRCSRSPARTPTASGCCGATPPASPSSPTTPEQLRERSVDASRALLAGQVRPDLYEWAAQTIVDHLVDAVLNWLEYGAPARDEEFVALATAGARAGIRAWVSR